MTGNVCRLFLNEGERLSASPKNQGFPVIKGRQCKPTVLEQDLGRFLNLNYIGKLDFCPYTTIIADPAGSSYLRQTVLC